MPEIRRLALPAFLALITACGGANDAGDPDGALGSGGGAPPSRTEPEPDRVDPAPMDTGAWVVEPPPADSAPSPHPWVSGSSRGGTAGSGAVMLVNVRTARQEGFDRIVFEFDRHVPEWTAQYVDTPQHECGSGEAVRLEGDGWLQVNFEMTNAHTEEGRATAAPRHVADPAGTNLREMRRICDFEAQTQYVVGVGSPNPYRAFQLSDPARLVVDIRH